MLINQVLSANATVEMLARVSNRMNVWPVCAGFHVKQINPLDIFCQKTGKFIGTRNEQEFQQTCELLGAAQAEISLFYSTSLAVHPLWLKTDNETLDRLMTIDALGYACFALNIATAGYYEYGWKPGHRIPTAAKRELLSGAYAERYWALVRCNQLLARHSTEKLQELNAALCRMLAYENVTLHYIFRVLGNKMFARYGSKIAKCADFLAAMPVDDLIAAISEATDAAINSLMFSSAQKGQGLPTYGVATKTPEDMTANHGRSNIRMQAQASRGVKTASVTVAKRKLENALKSISIFKESTIEKIVRQNMPIDAKSSREEQISWKEISKVGAFPPSGPKIDKDGFFQLDTRTLSLEAFDTMELSDLDDDEDYEDNTVEVHVLTRAQADTILSETRRAIPANTAQPMSAFTARLIAAGKLPSVTIENPPQTEMTKQEATLPTSKFQQLMAKIKG